MVWHCAGMGRGLPTGSHSSHASLPTCARPWTDPSLPSEEKEKATLAHGAYFHYPRKPSWPVLKTPYGRSHPRASTLKNQCWGGCYLIRTPSTVSSKC